MVYWRGLAEMPAKVNWIVDALEFKVDEPVDFLLRNRRLHPLPIRMGFSLITLATLVRRVIEFAVGLLAGFVKSRLKDAWIEEPGDDAGDVVLALLKRPPLENPAVHCDHFITKQHNPFMAGGAWHYDDNLLGYFCGGDAERFAVGTNDYIHTMPFPDATHAGHRLTRPKNMPIPCPRGSRFPALGFGYPKPFRFLGTEAERTPHGS